MRGMVLVRLTVLFCLLVFTAFSVFFAWLTTEKVYRCFHPVQKRHRRRRHRTNSTSDRYASEKKETTTPMKWMMIATECSVLSFTVALILSGVSFVLYMNNLNDWQWLWLVLNGTNKSKSSRPMSEDKAYEKYLPFRYAIGSIQLIGYLSLLYVLFHRLVYALEGSSYALQSTTVRNGRVLIITMVLSTLIPSLLIEILPTIVTLLSFAFVLVSYPTLSCWISFRFLATTYRVSLDSGDIELVDVSLRLSLLALSANLSTVMMGLFFIVHVLHYSVMVRNIRNTLMFLDSLINVYCLTCTLRIGKDAYYRMIFGRLHSLLLNRLNRSLSSSSNLAVHSAHHTGAASPKPHCDDDPFSVKSNEDIDEEEDSYSHGRFKE